MIGASLIFSISPVIITVLVLSYLREKDQTFKGGWRPMEVHGLLAALTRLADRIAPTKLTTSASIQIRPPMPPEVHEFVMAESEPWAVESLAQRYGELLEEFHSPAAALAALQRENQ